jgi:hypothetical protein
MHILNIDRVLMPIKQYLFLIDELFHLYSNVIWDVSGLIKWDTID